ncbi:MAG: hypothetical protein HY289_14770 [Planctomycetes bacterium]|nr:hypothetical protein [Planctomycetota bacterium]
MFSTRLPFLAAFAVVVVFLAAPLRSQDKLDPAALNKKKTQELLDKAQEEYRVFFKRPETALEFWSAIKFEMDLGKFDLAALHLKLMLEKDAKTVDPDLVKIEELEGLSAFLRLQRVKQWSDHKPFHDEAVKNVDVLLDRLTKSVETHLSDPVRIKKYIKQLDARTPEERGYAFVQINRSRERAIPYIIEELRTSFGKSMYPRLRETLLRMGPETVPVYLEFFKAQSAKDYRDVEMRITMLDIIRERDDKRVIPYLWHMAAAKQYPLSVRKKAQEVLAGLLRIGVDDLPPSRETLTQMAEQHYQHKVQYPADKSIKIWLWNGEAIALQPIELSPAVAEEEFGLRYAREALDLDSAYQPAQVVMLSMMLERTYRPKLQQALLEPLPPKTQQLLTTLDADLLMRVLERGMEDRQTTVVLPLIQALGERGEFRAARANSGEQPRGIVRGLYYPDRRVQFASMKAMLRMPQSSLPAVAADRIVELSRRFIAGGATAKALLVYAPAGSKAQARNIIKDLGFDAQSDAEAADSAQEAVKKGKHSADFDLIVLHRGVPDNEFAFAYAQLRKEFDLAGLPMIVVVDKTREKTIKKLTARDFGVIVVTEDKFKGDDALKALVDAQLRTMQGARLTDNERKLFASTSIDTLWRIARGELQGYDIRPALDVIKTQTRSPDYALSAFEILGRMPGKSNQGYLASLVGDMGQDLKSIRMPALLELNRHMQKNGVLIDKNQIANLKQVAKESVEGQPFRQQLNVTLSMITRTSGPQTGADLLRFQPDAPPAPPKEEKKEKEEK